MPKLLVLSDNAPVREFPLGPTTTIGRHPTQDLQILDRLVSKEHATVDFRGGHYVLTDLGSRNGSLVNSREVHGSLILENGDNITIGSTHLVYIAQPTEEVALSRVTIDQHSKQAIQAKTLQSSRVEFRPEHEVRDIQILRGDYEKLRLAFMLNQEVAMEFNQSRLLKKILDVLFQAFTVDRAIIFIYDKTVRELVPKHVKSVDGDETSDSIHVSNTILDQVMREKTSILSSDAMIDDRFADSQSVIMQGIRSTMTVPLLSSGDEVLGVIHTDSHVATNVFTERDLSIVQGFARQAALALENAILMENIRGQELARLQYERLLSPAIVERVVQGGLDVQKGGNLRVVTILFSDIRGFTSMSERLGANQIVNLLNEYFEIMVEIIFEHEGTLDKFIGDAIMAIWGAPFSKSEEEDAANAVSASVKMQRALREFNDLRIREDLEPIEIGVGLDTGHAVAGYMGSSRKLEYTVIGDSVNRASRICSAAGPGEILISEATLRQIGHQAICEEREPLRLKGISKLVNNYLVKGLRAPIN